VRKGEERGGIDGVIFATTFGDMEILVGKNA
jgi:hypothetical protein